MLYQQVKEKSPRVPAKVFVTQPDGLEVWFLEWLDGSLVCLGEAGEIVKGFSCSGCSGGGTGLRCFMTGTWRTRGSLKKALGWHNNDYHLLSSLPSPSNPRKDDKGGVSDTAWALTSSARGAALAGGTLGTLDHGLHHSSNPGLWYCVPTPAEIQSTCCSGCHQTEGGPWMLSLQGFRGHRSH